MKSPLKKIAILFSLMLLLSMNLFAGETGKISGYVVDKSTGEPLIGANVIVDGTYLGGATDLDGYYFIINVPPGKHKMIVSSMGYNRTIIQDVIVNVDRTTQIDVSLSGESITLDEEVVVVAQKPLITKDLTSSSSTVSAEEIKMMPVENMHQVVNIQAGVVDGHFRGGRGGEVSYLVDGIAVNDAYDGGVSIEVENNSIRQLEVISGTFNAEYGNAMSGIVNIITKDAGQNYSGSATAYVGKYYSNTNIYSNLDNFTSAKSADIQFSFDGPTKLIKNLGFFVSGRYVQEDGLYYGKRVYNMTDTNPFFPTGDGEYVKMSPASRKSVNGKLTYQGSSWKASWNTIFDDNENKYFDHAFEWAPDGLMNHYRDNLLNSFQFSFIPNQSSFASIKLAYNMSNYKGYLYEDEYDSRYLDPKHGLPNSDYTFRQGGQQTSRYERHTYTSIAQLAFESQISKGHKIKLGIEVNKYEIYNHGKDIVNLTEGELDLNNQEIFTLGYRALGTSGNQFYDANPYSISSYIQDKMEYDIMIVNLGVRFDYFNANTSMPIDMRNPYQYLLEQTNTVFGNPNFPGAGQTVAVKAKSQISPRLGLSFPISDKGAIHFSYGHFFQMPTMQYLYQNNDYIIDQSALNSVTGNPDLKAQKTVKYELGIQQVIFPNVAVDFSVYYSDIRNLLATEILSTYEGFKYARFTNKDYANVTGAIISLDKRFSDNFSMKVDYTLQIVEGNSSDPMSVYNDTKNNVEPEKVVVPLNWDQRHTVNLSANVGVPGDWIVGFIARYGSGTPYTEDTKVSNSVTFENGGRKPSSVYFDLKADKNFNLLGIDFHAILLVYNLFDILNENGVYSTTGRAGTDLNVKYAGEINGLNTIDEFVNNPGMYSSPRQIKLGLSVVF
ncbi:MAG: TonB-dependent receptor [Bacteroidetes bacterium]|nr:TonB-dependent receptor [Bacteroidota bacterium]MBU1116830.1 TonB-dependent receptor [Bacteroidota bacterium]MBU1796887.1 TonB-dependent receptor [Bacteroidota bacterium]